mgnify:CR=1 FL=1
MILIDSGIDQKDESHHSMATSIEFNPPRDSVSSPLPSTSLDQQYPDHPDDQSADSEEHKAEEIIDQNNNPNKEANNTKWLKSIAPRGWKSSYR